MGDWVRLAEEEGGDVRPGGPLPAPLRFAVHKAEAVGVALLCWHDVEVRRLGMQLLDRARDLHRRLHALKATGGESSEGAKLQDCWQACSCAMFMSVYLRGLSRLCFVHVTFLRCKCVILSAPDQGGVPRHLFSELIRECLTVVQHSYA